MNKPNVLYKTTVIIWSTIDPTDKFELDDLAREAINGEMFCSDLSTEKIEDVSQFPDTEFFWS